MDKSGPGIMVSLGLPLSLSLSLSLSQKHGGCDNINEKLRACKQT
jgi:hypothetical protein